MVVCLCGCISTRVCCGGDACVGRRGFTKWTLGSAWFIGKDTSTSSRPITGAVPSGTNTLYSHNGNYPNNMGSTIWATSPVMNCGGCSGGWDLTFKRQLGVESSSWDHAYVQIKSSSGSWTNIWQNSGSVSDGSSHHSLTP